MGTTFPARPEETSIFRTELEAGTRKSHGKTGKALPAHGLRLAGWGIGGSCTAGFTNLEELVAIWNEGFF